MPALFPAPVLLRVTYWMPDHPSLLQRFEHQYDDLVPEIPRTHEFLRFWQRAIVAPINTVELDVGDGKLRPVRMRHVDALLLH